MLFSLLILHTSTLEFIKGKWFVQGCYVMNQCQSLLTRVLALCSTILGLFSGTTWEKTNSPSTWQPFQYLVTVLRCPKSPFQAKWPFIGQMLPLQQSFQIPHHVQSFPKMRHIVNFPLQLWYPEMNPSPQVISVKGLISKRRVDISSCNLHN